MINRFFGLWAACVAVLAVAWVSFLVWGGIQIIGILQKIAS